MQPAESPSLPVRRARGRPRRLTPEAVLDAALALLEDAPTGDFTLGRLARRLEVPITSLYTYFPNRDALLDAAGERMFARFDWQPSAGAAADELLLSWMRALARHFEHYPLTYKLLAWDRHISPAWLRAMTPVMSALHAGGLRGAALAETFGWFINGTIGLIDAHAHSSRIAARPPLAALDLGATSDADVQAQLELWRHAPALDHAAVLDHGFRVLVAGVVEALGAAGAHEHESSKP